jgi:DNA-binding NarL/FixJ family response regulator
MPVCGEAADGKQAIEKVRELKPDVVVLDINMPVMNGIEAACEIHRIAPATKILFFTINGFPEAVAASRLLGVDGFVSKSAAGTDLIPALKRLLPE